MVATIANPEDRVRPLEHATGYKTYLGNYMPFAGVTYYGIFNEQDIVEGRTRVGPVGWRRAKGTPGEEPAREIPVPLAA